MIIVILLPLHCRHCLLGPFSLPPVFLSSAMCEAHITSAQIVSTGKSNHLIQSCWKCSRGFPLPVRKNPATLSRHTEPFKTPLCFPYPASLWLLPRCIPCSLWRHYFQLGMYWLFPPSEMNSPVPCLPGTAVLIPQDSAQRLLCCPPSNPVSCLTPILPELFPCGIKDVVTYFKAVYSFFHLLT